MSYEQLMQHARDIQEKATKWAVVFSKRGLGDSAPPSYSSVNPSDYPWAQKLFADIPGLFQPYSELPDPASFDPLIADMTRAMRLLSWGPDPKDPIDGTIYPANTALDKLSGSESYLENWTGRAAMDFKAHFIDTFPSVERNQFIITSVLKSALDAHKAIWKTARHDIDDIAHKTIEALDHMDDCGKNQWGITFTVLACLAGIMAAPLSGGASLAVSIVGTAAWVAAADPPDSAPKTQFSGESPGAVISCMRDAISKLTQDIQGQEQKIAGALQSTHGLVSANRNLFVSARPALAGATAGTITNPENMGYSL